MVCGTFLRNAYFFCGIVSGINVIYHMGITLLLFVLLKGKPVLIFQVLQLGFSIS